MGRLEDRVILITGAARGQGAAEARMAASEGAIVIVADVADEAGNDTAAEIGGSYHHLDVTSASNWRDVVGEIVASHGRIDGLVNLLGVRCRSENQQQCPNRKFEC